MTTAERASILATYCQNKETERFLGYFAAIDLIHWVTHELGSAQILDDFQPISESHYSKAIPNGPILHILSGNTPHAGLQSLVRGIIIGAENWVKLPSSGLPEVEQWIANLPSPLQPLITIIKDPDQAIADANTIIAIGSDETIQQIHSKLKPHQNFIPHGHKLSIGLIEKPSEEAASLLVQDSCAFNQQGCLSLHTIYLKQDAKGFLPMLATAMQAYEESHPRDPISLSESGAITNLRESIRYEAANAPDSYEILHSDGNTNWTVIYRNSPALIPSPLNRVISVQPWPETPELLGAEANYLSTIAIDSSDAIREELKQLEELNQLHIPRICPIGRSQQPSLLWHHDGFAPLSSLVKWRDREL